jgi:RNA polymerase sigma-70 factor (ECF subfamily)
VFGASYLMMTFSDTDGVMPGAARSRLEEDFDVMYRAELGRLIVALRAMGGSRSGAEEVAQDAFAHAWARWGRVSRSPSPAGWVYVTAFRMLRRRRPRQPTFLRLGGGDDHSDVVGDRVDVARALRRLPGPQREVVVLRYLLGLSTAEVATHLGVAAGTVRVRLHRGVTALRAELATSKSDNEPSRPGGAHRG